MYKSLYLDCTIDLNGKLKEMHKLFVFVLFFSRLPGGNKKQNRSAYAPTSFHKEPMLNDCVVDKQKLYLIGVKG